ncbi:Transcriptional activator of fatty acid utilization [Apophysomyces sp. BC1034]|nr:Transcriptional activator of fatty acid utilization [Apophysomyces sp. BC1015]KAG0187242.1 Transcriptional activator of fatty acid utilization [Apophysomyces sp. BC1034]
MHYSSRPSSNIRLNKHALDNPSEKTYSRKQPLGGSSDRVQYLGDLSSFQFFSNKMHLDGNDRATWKGHHIRKFGKQVVLVEDNHEENTTDSKVPHLSYPDLFPQTGSVDRWIYSVTGADRHTSDRLLKIYFANVHPVLPVVNKTEFLKQYRDQADTYPSPDLLNAMFGAAARFVECEALNQKNKAYQPPETVWDVPWGWSDQFFDQAQTIVSASAANPTISKVQSIILIHNHSGNLDSKSSACWLLGGLAIRLAQGLGLNRDCEEWDIPESEKQTRKRIWWALYVTDRFHSASLGRPINIRDEDNDVGYPDATASWKEVLDEPELNTQEKDPRFPSAAYRPTSVEGRVEIYQLFIQLVKLSEILGRILQGLYTPKAQRISHDQGSDAIVTRLDHELTEWRFGFPKALQRANFDDFDENKGYLAPVAASVLLCYFSLLILLHRPFIERIAVGKTKARPSYSSFRIGTSAATRGMRIAAQMTVRDFLMFPYSFSLYPVLQCCLIHMYNTKNPDARISSPAKADLAKGLDLVDRLRQMSNSAQKLHSLMTIIIENKDIDVSTAQSEQDEQKKTGANGLENVNSSFPTRVSDVGRGIFRQSPKRSLPPSTLAESPNKDPTPLLFQQPTLSNFSFPAWNDMSGIASSSPSPTSMAEAFTLKQFGFNTPGDPTQFDYILQDVSAFSAMDSLPPLPIHPQYAQSMGLPPSTAMLPSSSAMAPSQHIPTSLPLPSVNIPLPITTATDEGNVFRNNPNNPFFGIPSSMDWTEWNEWNQSAQGTASWQPLH